MTKNDTRTQVKNAAFIFITVYVVFGLCSQCIDQAVKMAGFWPSSFCPCLWKETKHARRELRETQRVIPSGQDSTIPPSRVDKYRARFGLSRLLTALAI